jgi:CRP-like cAMP-binding protein
MDEMHYLEDVSIFSHMKKKDLKRVAKLANPLSCKAGDVIVREGERDGRLYIIISGEAEVIKGMTGPKEWRLRSIGPRSYFGEMALMDDWIRTASVVAKTDMQLLTLNHWNLRNEIETYPIIAVEMLQMMSRRVRQLEKSLIDTLDAFMPLCDDCSSKCRDDCEPPDHGDGEAETVDAIMGGILCDKCREIVFPKLKQRE